MLIKLIPSGQARPEHPFDCELLEREFELSGTHGMRAIAKERMVLNALVEVTAFPYMVRTMDGTIEREVITLRDLKNNRPATELGPANIVGVAQNGPMTVTILPPFPIRYGDRIEICRETTAKDSFPKNDESVGKTIIYPTKSLKLKVTFVGCPANNGIGTKVVATPVDGQAIPIEPSSDGTSTMQWEVPNTKPGEKYLLSWRWVG